MDLSTKTMTELKAMAYDNLNQLEVTKQNLNILNEAMKKREELDNTPEVEEKKPKK